MLSVQPLLSKKKIFPEMKAVEMKRPSTDSIVEISQWASFWEYFMW